MKVFIVASNGIPMALDVIDENRNNYFVKIGSELHYASKHDCLLRDSEGSVISVTYSNVEVAISKALSKANEECNREVQKVISKCANVVQRINQWRIDETD